MELTVTLNDEVVESARACAERRGVTIEALIEACIEQLDAPESPGDGFVRLANEHPGHAEPGWRFSREECYDRPSLRRWSDS